MIYNVTIRIGKYNVQLPIEAISANEALNELSPFHIEEVYPSKTLRVPRVTLAKKETTNPFSPDFNKVGIEAEPFIPDGIRNELLLDLANFITEAISDYSITSDLRRKKDRIKEELNHIKTYFNKST